MANLTLENAFAAAKESLKNISDVGESAQFKIATEVNRHLRNVIRSYDPELLISEDTISVLADTAAYALPSDFGSITDPGTGLYTTDEDDNLTDIKRIMVWPGSTNTGFWIDSANINLTPTPQSAETLILRYMTKDVRFTSTSDIFVVDDAWTDLVEDGLTVGIWQHRRDSNRERIAGERFANSIRDFIQHVDRTPKVFSRRDNSRYF